jgi:hypothetical protein
MEHLPFVCIASHVRTSQSNTVVTQPYISCNAALYNSTQQGSEAARFLSQQQGTDWASNA